MRVLFVTLMLPFLTNCMLLPPAPDSPRRSRPASSDIDSLEMLLLNDQQPIYSQRSPQGLDLSLGMQKRKVEMSLGRPAQVEVAGNPKYGNERWTYETAVPTLEGYYTERKIIYFEGGSVVGWESQ